MTSLIEVRAEGVIEIIIVALTVVIVALLIYRRTSRHDITIHDKREKKDE